MLVGDHPGAPMPHLDGFDLALSATSAVSPQASSSTWPEPPNQVPIALLHHDRDIAPQVPERAQVGVIHVGMGEQD